MISALANYSKPKFLWSLRLLLILGLLFVSQFALPHKALADTTTASDNFARADGPLGPNWTDISDGGMAISSGAVTGKVGALTGDMWTANTFTSDQFSQVEVASTPLTGGQWIGPAVRAQAGGQNAYVGIYYWNSGSPEMILFKRSGGGWAQIGAAYNSGPLAAGTQLEVTAIGSTISFLENGTRVITATDSSITGGAPGIMAYGNAEAGSWSGGNAANYTIGGTVSGLSGTVVLQDNGGDNLSVTSNGSFTFATPVASGAAYAVTVQANPSGQTCTVANGSGTVASANVTNVAVTCTNNSTGGSFSVGGTVSGLSGTVVLQDNGGDNLSVSANGSFTFATPVASGAGYNVTVMTYPSGQTCTVANGSGTVASANVTNVAVTCTNNSTATSASDNFARANGSLQYSRGFALRVRGVAYCDVTGSGCGYIGSPLSGRPWSGAGCGGEAGGVVVPSGAGLVAAPPPGPAQVEGEAGAGDEPGGVLAGEAGQPGGLGDGEPDRADAGRARLPGPGGDGRVAERDAQVSTADLLLFFLLFLLLLLGAGGREGDVAAQGVADGGVAELGEGGQGGVPTGRVPGPGLGLVPAEHVLPGFERLLAGPAPPGDRHEERHRGRLVFRSPAQVKRQVARPGEQAADQQDVPRAGGGGQGPVRVPGSLGPVPARAALEDRVLHRVRGLDHRAGRQGDAEVPRDDRDVGQARGLACPAQGAAAPIHFVKGCPPGRQAGLQQALQLFFSQLRLGLAAQPAGDARGPAPRRVRLPPPGHEHIEVRPGLPGCGHVRGEHGR